MSAAPETPNEAVFKKRTAILLAAVCAISLVATLIVSALSGEVSETRSANADAFSRSALGYHGLARVLDESGVPTEVSRHDSEHKVGPGRPLLIAEPRPPRTSLEDDESAPLDLRSTVMVARGRDAEVIVVLPKWEGVPMQKNPGWVEHIAFTPESRVCEVLERAAGQSCSAGAIVRSERPLHFSTELSSGLLPDLPAPQLLRPSALDSGFEPLVWSEEGILIGRDPVDDVIVVADPDLINNAGLGRGDNAALFLDLLTKELGAKTLVIDETLHGYTQSPSLWAELFRFPLVLVTLHFAGLFLVVLWATMGRFGKAEPLPPRLAPGKRALVDNTAELFATGGHSAYSLEHYFQMVLRSAAAAWALPQGLAQDELVARLRALGQAHGITIDIGALGERVRAELSTPRQKRDPRTILAIARVLFRYRQEIERGNQ